MAAEWARHRLWSTAGLRTAAELGFRVVKEDVVWARWLQVSDRTIRFPPRGGRQVPFLFAVLPTSIDRPLLSDPTMRFPHGAAPRCHLVTVYVSSSIHLPVLAAEHQSGVGGHRLRTIQVSLCVPFQQKATLVLSFLILVMWRRQRSTNSTLWATRALASHLWSRCLSIPRRPASRIPRCALQTNNMPAFRFRFLSIGCQPGRPDEAPVALPFRATLLRERGN